MRQDNRDIGSFAPEIDPVPTRPSEPLAPAYDAASEAKRLLRTVRAGCLATLDAAGRPFATLVNVATAPDGSPVLLMSTLAAHTRNLEARPEASILLPETGKGDPLAHPRLTVSGALARDSDPVLRRRFLARHPKSALYAGFKDFSFWRMTVAGFHLNGGFARAADFAPEAILTDIAGAEGLFEAEEGALAHLNEDHADALRLYAARDGHGAGRWKATGLDPEGLDMSAGDKTARLGFPERVVTPSDLRKTLVRLAEAARAADG
jgi:heme iron utilization protein